MSKVPRTREDVLVRLRELLTKVQRDGWARLRDREVTTLGKLYRSAANQLARQRTFGASARSVQELNQLVANAHAVIYGRRVKRHRTRTTLLFQLLAVPVAVRRSWPYHLAAAVLLVLAMVYGYTGASSDPDWALSFMFPGDDRTPYASRDELLQTLMTGRDGSVHGAEKTVFAAMLWQNNTKVSLMAFFLGFLGGIPTALLVVFNGTMLGTYTYTFHRHDLAFEWWAWILPHGVTEMGAIVLLAGGGLWIGHIMLNPGDATRGERLRECRADVVRLLCLAFPALLLAAVIESFVRQSGLGDIGRYVFAAVTLVLWVLYLGFVRPGRQLVERLAEPVTTAQRNVPLPGDDELLGVLRRR